MIYTNGFVGLILVAATFLGSMASADASRRPGAGRAFGNYDDVKTFLGKLVKDHPDTVTPIDLGLSDSGQHILGVKISKPGSQGGVNNMVVSTHHGNEYGSTEVAMAFAKDVAENPIVGQTMFVIPVLNINGYNAGDRYESSERGQSFDPNRNYPGPCGTEGPFTLKSTKALADFIAANGITASATLHTFYPAVVYPWGISTQDLKTPYDDLFKGLVQAATVESKYQTGNSTEVIYPADGTYEDYAFWKHGIWSILFELGFSHDPSHEDVNTMVSVNVPGMRRMMEQAPRERAQNHDFTGKCDTSNRSLDRHDE